MDAVSLSAAAQLTAPTPPTWTPLHETVKEADAQLRSRLYNNHMPAEVRNVIFSLAMKEYTRSEPEAQYGHKNVKYYSRPGYEGKKAVTFGLLLTCRKTYLETWHLPMISKEHVFWNFHTLWDDRRPRQNYPQWHPGIRNSILPETIYFQSLHASQLQLVKEIHIFAHVEILEDLIIYLCKEDFMQGIEKIKISIPRDYWYRWECNNPMDLRLDDSISDASFGKDWENGEAFEKRDNWGYAFAQLSSLRELEFELETSEDKVAELDDIVEKIQTWQFPMCSGKVLRVEGAATKWTWRGPEFFWSAYCIYCGRCDPEQYSGYIWDNYCDALASDPVECREKRELQRQGLGPMATVCNLRWKLGRRTKA